jgi:hypothetical protein
LDAALGVVNGKDYYGRLFASTKRGDTVSMSRRLRWAGYLFGWGKCRIFSEFFRETVKTDFLECRDGRRLRKLKLM